MKRSKTSLPLTRFVAPKRLTTNINQVPNIETPSSSLTPIDDDSTMKGTDETADNEEVEDVVTVDRTKQMNTSGSTIEGDVDKAIMEEEEEQEGPDPSAILKSVETLHQDFIKHQTNFAEFVDKATSRIAKLENSISSNAQDEEEKRCKEGLQVLKNLMADTYKSSSTKVYVSALSFGDFDQQQSRTRSHLSRFTQLDSEDESAQSPTIDPSMLQPTRLLIEPAQSSGTSPDSSSQVQPSSQTKESEEEPPSSQQQVDAPVIVPEHQSPELNSDVEDLGSQSPLASPQFSPYRPSSSGAAASRPMSIDNSQIIRSSSPRSFPQATQATQSPEPTQSPLPTQPTQLLEATQSTQLTLPTSPPLPTSTHTNSQTQALANKRLRRNQTLPARKKPPAQQPPLKKQKTQKSITKSKPKKKPSTGQTGSLPVGTLKKSQGITRVKGADWPELGPNTVIGLGGYIECETCLGPVHRSCAGLRDDEEIPELTWICPDCDYIREHGGKDLPKVMDTETCIRSTCIRRKHVKVDWKPADAELFVILQAIGRRPLQPARSFSKGKYEYLTLWKGYPLNESTWEPVESFVAAKEMARQFETVAESEGIDFKKRGEDVVLLKEAMEAFGEDGELKV